MHSTIAIMLAAGTLASAAEITSGHGAGAMGTIMGPMSFLWPGNRAWSEDHDNTAPCGSSDGVGSRTTFPLTGGFVTTTIAEDSFDVEFSISYSENPQSNADFTSQIVATIEKVEPGHQCYKVAAFPSNVTSGTKATIQMEYRSTYLQEANQQTFYTCADIELVETAAFALTPSCFNVVSGEFDAPSTATPTPSAEAAPAAQSSSNALTSGAIAGIAVGTVVGSLAVVGVIAFLMFRKRRAAAAAPELPVAHKNPEVASVRS